MLVHSTEVRGKNGVCIGIKRAVRLEIIDLRKEKWQEVKP